MSNQFSTQTELFDLTGKRGLVTGGTRGKPSPKAPMPSCVSPRSGPTGRRARSRIATDLCRGDIRAEGRIRLSVGLLRVTRMGNVVLVDVGGVVGVHTLMIARPVVGSLAVHRLRCVTGHRHAWSSFSFGAIIDVQRVEGAPSGEHSIAARGRGFRRHDAAMAFLFHN